MVFLKLIENTGTRNGHSSGLEFLLFARLPFTVTLSCVVARFQGTKTHLNVGPSQTCLGGS